MRVRDAMLMVFIGVTLTLAVGGYLFYESQRNNTDTSSQQVATQSAGTARQNTAAQQPALQQPGQSNQGLQVQGMNSSSAQPPAPSLPSPDQFGTYEQYANNDNILYVDEVIGSGDIATNGDRVAMLYKGWLTDGTLFDQTKVNEQGQLQPFVFQIGDGQVIRGWDMGITDMKVGGKRRLVIPSAFGYGPAGQGPIPPNAMLIFDVELVAVESTASPN